MNKKALILVGILFLPICIYIFFHFTTIRYVPVPVFGPKLVTDTVISGKAVRDTVYYSVPSLAILDPGNHRLSKTEDSMRLVAFIDPSLIKKNYHLGSYIEYYRSGKKDVDTLPLIIVVRGNDSSGKKDYAKAFGLNPVKTYSVSCSDSSFHLLKEKYFPEGKIHAEKNLILVDKHDRIRGYYDGRYVKDIDFLKEDVMHIVFHDEASGMSEKFRIEQKINEKGK